MVHSRLKEPKVFSRVAIEEVDIFIVPVVAVDRIREQDRMGIWILRWPPAVAK